MQLLKIKVVSLNKIKDSVSQTSLISVLTVLHRTDREHFHHQKVLLDSTVGGEDEDSWGLCGLPKGKFREDSLGGGPAASHCSSAEAQA